ncbi:MAG: hypothetical protein Q7U96_05510, partial [Chloroflexota bacterium]|nr:hypothetical protein [Chloroflexota bacterium]
MLRVLRSVSPILLAGAAAGIALWDWSYPLQLVSLLSGGRVYAFYTWQLLWFIIGGAAGALLFWLIRVNALARHRTPGGSSYLQGIKPSAWMI